MSIQTQIECRRQGSVVNGVGRDVNDSIFRHKKVLRKRGRAYWQPHVGLMEVQTHCPIVNSCQLRGTTIEG